MNPMLSKGSIIVVQSKSVQNFCCGDIIVWEQGEYWNTHRIVKIESHCCVTKGDANWNFDRPFDIESILGCVTAVEESNARWDLAHFPWNEVSWLVGKLSGFEGSIIPLNGLAGEKRTPSLKILIVAPIRIVIKILLTVAKLASKKKISN